MLKLEGPFSCSCACFYISDADGKMWLTGEGARELIKLLQERLGDDSGDG